MHGFIFLYVAKIRGKICNLDSFAWKYCNDSLFVYSLEPYIHTYIYRYLRTVHKYINGNIFNVCVCEL